MYNQLTSSIPQTIINCFIYKADLAKFNEPEKAFLNKKVCVTGKLVLYNDKPQIVVNEPKQIFSN